jgi:hypothetical protein
MPREAYDRDFGWDFSPHSWRLNNTTSLKVYCNRDETFQGSRSLFRLQYPLRVSYAAGSVFFRKTIHKTIIPERVQNTSVTIARTMKETVLFNVRQMSDRVRPRVPHVEIENRLSSFREAVTQSRLARLASPPTRSLPPKEPWSQLSLPLGKLLVDVLDIATPAQGRLVGRTFRGSDLSLPLEKLLVPVHLLFIAILAQGRLVGRTFRALDVSVVGIARRLRHGGRVDGFILSFHRAIDVVEGAGVAVRVVLYHAIKVVLRDLDVLVFGRDGEGNADIATLGSLERKRRWLVDRLGSTGQGKRLGRAVEVADGKVRRRAHRRRLDNDGAGSRRRFREYEPTCQRRTKGRGESRESGVGDQDQRKKERERDLRYLRRRDR